jgi:hypothetical protein
MTIFKSRKFWLMVSDVVISTATYLVSSYIDPVLADKIIWLIGTWQPVVIAVILGIAVEDAASNSAPVV